MTLSCSKDFNNASLVFTLSTTPAYVFSSTLQSYALNFRMDYYWGFMQNGSSDNVTASLKNQIMVKATLTYDGELLLS